MAIFFGVITFNSYQRSQKFLAKAATTSGTVVRLHFSPFHSVRSSGGGFYPIVRFIADGEEIEARDRIGANPPDYRQGETVEVLYEKGNPKHWCINSWFDLWFLTTLFGFFFAVSTTMTTFATISKFKNQRRLDR